MFVDPIRVCSARRTLENYKWNEGDSRADFGKFD